MSYIQMKLKTKKKILTKGNSLPHHRNEIIRSMAKMILQTFNSQIKEVQHENFNRSKNY